MLSHFEKSDAQGPNVRGYGVGFASDALRGHVVRSSDEGVGVPFGAKFPTHAKVAKAHLAGPSQEYVGRFDVWERVSKRSEERAEIVTTSVDDLATV